jgi:hypothetical protein
MLSSLVVTGQPAVDGSDKHHFKTEVFHRGMWEGVSQMPSYKNLSHPMEETNLRDTIYITRNKCLHVKQLRSGGFICYHSKPTAHPD